MSAPLEQCHIDILARYILHCRVASFAEDQRITAVRHYLAVDRDYNPFGVALDRDGMSRPWDLDRLRRCIFLFRHVPPPRHHAFKNRVACPTKSSGYWWCAP